MRSEQSGLAEIHPIRSGIAVFTLATRALDVVTILLALSLAGLARQTLPFGRDLTPEGGSVDISVFVMAGLIWVLASGTLDLYRLPRTIDPVRQSTRATAVLIVVCALFAGALYMSFRDLSRLLFLYFFLFSAFGLIGIRFALVALLQRTLPREQRVLIVGTGPIARTVARNMRTIHRGIPRISIAGFACADNVTSEDHAVDSSEILGDIDHLAELVEKLDIHDVIVALPPGNASVISNLIPVVREHGVGLRIVPDLIELAATRATLESLDGIPVIRLRDSALNLLERAEKRAFDICVSLVALFLLSPIMALVALAVRLDSGSPVFYRAVRVGRGGRLFSMYKFRTMIPMAEARLREVLEERGAGDSIFKVPDDPRVTRIGRLLRRTSLDELPQLLNVLRGDMTLVGPRPEQPLVVETYRPWQRRRLDVRPGMTGWWQISGRDLPMNLHTEFDLYYLDNYSLALDVKILAKTAWAVIHGRGAF